MEADVPMGEGGDSGSASSTYGPCGRRMCGLVGNGCQGDAGVVGEFTIRRNFTHWVFKRGAFVVPFSASSVCGKLPSPTTSQTSARRLGSARDTQCRCFFFPKQFTVGALNSILRCVRIVSGVVSAFWTGLQSCVSLCLPLFVSLCLLSSVCQGRCPPSGLVCNHLSPFVSLYLSPFVSFHLCVRGGVRLLDWQSFVSLCLPSIVSFCLLSSVCQGRCPPSGLVCNHLSPFASLHLSHFVSFHLCVRGGVRLLDGSAIMCLPLSPFICLPLSPFICVSGVVSAFWTGLQSFVSLCLHAIVSFCLLSSVCQGWCPPSGLVCNHLSHFVSLQ